MAETRELFLRLNPRQPLPPIRSSSGIVVLVQPKLISARSCCLCSIWVVNPWRLSSRCLVLWSRAELSLRPRRGVKRRQKSLLQKNRRTAQRKEKHTMALKQNTAPFIWKVFSLAARNLSHTKTRAVSLNEQEPESLLLWINRLWRDCWRRYFITAGSKLCPLEEGCGPPERKDFLS